MGPKHKDNKIKNYPNTRLKKRQADMAIDWVTRKRRSNALRIDGGGPGGGASGTQHAKTHHTPQWESVKLEARAHDAKRLYAFADSASASVSAPPRMPGPAAMHQLLKSHPMSLLLMMGIHWVTRKRRSDALGTGRRGPGGGASGTQHATTHRLRAFAASTSASVSAPPQMPGPAAVHQLDSPPTPTLSFSQSPAQAASALEEFHAAVAAAPAPYGMQPMQQVHEETARNEDYPQQQQRWGDHFIDAADADILAAGYAGMLLDESLHEQQTEIEKKYWEGIMHLVNSPLETSVAVPTALEASSSSAPLQTSVAMPAPEASLSAAAASFSTSVAVPPRDA